MFLAIPFLVSWAFYASISITNTINSIFFSPFFQNKIGLYHSISRPLNVSFLNFETILSRNYIKLINFYTCLNNLFNKDFRLFSLDYGPPLFFIPPLSEKMILAKSKE